MNWFESIIYGLISGLTEFLPLSSSAHQQIYLQICGEVRPDYARNLFVHIGLLIAVQFFCRPMFLSIKQSSSNTRRINTVSKLSLDYRFAKAATFPMLVMFSFLTYILNESTNLILTGFVFIVNGFLMFIPDRMIKGNKDSRSMSSLDCLLFGFAGALAAIPGFSGLGASVSVGAIRGADRQNALKWALFLSIPTLMAFIVIDSIKLFSGNSFSAWNNLFHYILSLLGAFGAGYCSIKFIHYISTRQSYSIFSYYCWGAALITFFLYLTVV